MKTTFSLLCCLALLFCASSLQAATLRGADEYLVSPESYEGQIITLNVGFVRPSTFQNSQPDVICFNAKTHKFDNKFGGNIQIVVPKGESEHFASYYGMNPRGKSSRILSGTLLKNNNHWYVDFKNYGFSDKGKTPSLSGSSN